MKEIICGVVGLLCSGAVAPADDKPFNRKLYQSEASISWDLKPDVVAELIREYLISKGEVVKQGTATLECGEFYASNGRICRYTVRVVVPFDADKP